VALVALQHCDQQRVDGNSKSSGHSIDKGIGTAIATKNNFKMQQSTNNDGEANRNDNSSGSGNIMAQQMPKMATAAVAATLAQTQ